MNDPHDIWDSAVDHAQRLSKLNTFLEKNDVKFDFNQLVQLDAELMEQQRNKQKQ